MKAWVAMGVLVVLLWGSGAGAADDPWDRLRKAYTPGSDSQALGHAPKGDPWARLRAVFLPFSRQEEKAAAANPGARKAFTQRFDQRLAPFEPAIARAGVRFDVPTPLIKAVIMVESGGDPGARAKTSTAKGLMQTIDGTFAMARTALAKQGIHIPDDPFDPEASIMAGTWYLARMYEKCLDDGKISPGNRNALFSWRRPLAYYYAGPGYGAREKNKILIFSNGKKWVIDKGEYVKKVMGWADLITA